MLGDFISAILAKFVALAQWFGELGKAVFTALWDLLRDAVCWPFEQIMDIVVTAVSALDLSGLSNYTGTWHTLPAELLNVLALIGVAEASAIIITAIGIRLILQLIPFTRLGS
ncbi:Protein of unknown function (DUF2523) [Acidovorax sp. CF316]|uniref:DUF2523 family protein n=1 Tax=Acidovorax sp. CF316 TaxID=1144317 RepID=UPI00026BD757|nr:DUF2523 family protein [Acidovorax sp. CF316]EJE52903.1 Protein of unknown function (DUF2523) [Acidovorax sp. CF316]